MAYVFYKNHICFFICVKKKHTASSMCGGIKSMCGGIKTLKHNVRTTLQPAYHQGRINHWANRANARGFALLGASHSHNQNTPLLVFHVFRLFTMRRNCRAFLLLCLLYTLRKLT